MDWHASVQHSEVTVYEGLGMLRVKGKLYAMRGETTAQKAQVDGFLRERLWLSWRMQGRCWVNVFLFGTGAGMQVTVLADGLQEAMRQLAVLQRAGRGRGARLRLAALCCLGRRLPLELAVRCLGVSLQGQSVVEADPV